MNIWKESVQWWHLKPGDQERSSVKCQRVEGCGGWSSRLHVRGACLLPVGSPHPRSSMPSLSRGLGVMSYARTFCIVLFLMKWYPGVLVNHFHSGLLLCDVLLHRKQKVAGEGFRSDPGTWVSMVTGQYCVNGAWKQILVLYFMRLLGQSLMSQFKLNIRVCTRQDGRRIANGKSKRAVNCGNW